MAVSSLLFSFVGKESMNYALTRITYSNGKYEDYILGPNMMGDFVKEAIKDNLRITMIPIDELDAVILEPRLVEVAEIRQRASDLLKKDIEEMRENENLQQQEEAACQCFFCQCTRKKEEEKEDEDLGDIGDRSYFKSVYGRLRDGQ